MRAIIAVEKFLIAWKIYYLGMGIIRIVNIFLSNIFREKE